MLNINQSINQSINIGLCSAFVPKLSLSICLSVRTSTSRTVSERSATRLGFDPVRSKSAMMMNTMINDCPVPSALLLPTHEVWRFAWRFGRP